MRQRVVPPELTNCTAHAKAKVGSPKPLVYIQDRVETVDEYHVILRRSRKTNNVTGSTRRQYGGPSSNRHPHNVRKQLSDIQSARLSR